MTDDDLKAAGYDPEKPWEWEGKCVLRTLEWLIPLVRSNVTEPARLADFDVMVWSLKHRFKMEKYIQTGLKVHGGPGGRAMTEEERQTRIAILGCYIEIARRTGDDRGIAGRIKNKLKLDMSERHIRRILDEAYEEKTGH